MILIFYYNNYTQNLSLEIDDNKLTDCIISMTPVKEISFIHNLQSEKDKIFDEIEKKIRLLPFLQINEINIIDSYSKQKKYTIKEPIKAVYNRVQLYSRAKHLEAQEHLSIRFFPENKIIINNQQQIIECDKKCKYFHSGYCKNYSEYLKNIDSNSYCICLKCFLECTNYI